MKKNLSNEIIFYNEATSIPIDVLNSVIMKKPKKQEHNLQVSIINYLRLNKIFCFAVPNGGSRNAREGANLKKEGVMAGVSDLIILLPNKAIFVEIKTDKGRQQETQKLFEEKVKGLGFDYLVWRNIDDAIRFIQN